MATAANDMPKRKRVRYSAEYRAEALALAERIGVAAAASELGLHATQIYQWRAKAAHEKSVTDRERQLREENARLKRQLADKTETVTILGKNRGVLRKEAGLKYAAIHQHRSAHSIALQCAVLGVSRSGYYAWLRRRDSVSQRLAERTKRDEKVIELFEAKKRRYGSPRLREELEAEGMTMNRKTVAESMRRQGLRARAAKPFRHTTDSGHSLGVALNLLAQDFSATRPDEKWAGDITYLRTIQGWLYLAVILDLCTRKVIGWATSTRIDAELACTALRAALARRGEPSDVIMHTDRGSVYCGWDHRNLIRRYGLVASMSGRGNCYDNAVVESFFHSLKVESIHGVRLMHPDALRQALFEYIEVEYNRTRRHSALGTISPDAFEARIVA
ncbi:IS3 family transposase [Spiribacter sp. 221]|uniref:IS3 family transposase n=1 Tax=Spiribacter onubensis TaxID=3122420 RepID=UPI00349F25F6